MDGLSPRAKERSDKDFTNIQLAQLLMCEILFFQEFSKIELNY